MRAARASAGGAEIFAEVRRGSAIVARLHDPVDRGVPRLPARLLPSRRSTPDQHPRRAPRSGPDPNPRAAAGSTPAPRPGPPSGNAGGVVVRQRPAVPAVRSGGGTRRPAPPARAPRRTRRARRRRSGAQRLTYCIARACARTHCSCYGGPDANDHDRSGRGRDRPGHSGVGAGRRPVRCACAPGRPPECQVPDAGPRDEIQRETGAAAPDPQGHAGGARRSPTRRTAGFSPRAYRRRVRDESPARLADRVRSLRRELKRERREPIAPAAASPTLEAIAACESGGNPATNTGNGFYGKYQFTLQTWQSVGGSGNPADASEAEQNKRAALLYAREGASPWPVCGR